MASPVLQPSARSSPFVASAGNLTYLWGGRGDTEPEAVFIHHGTETWTRRLTSGQHPPAGLQNGGCAMSGHKLYLYGGYDESYCKCGDLYELNTQTWLWRKLSDGSAGGPGKKSGCRMISYQDQLLVVGGFYNEMPNSRQAGADYEQLFRSSFCTNEVHGYSLTSGLWSSPPIKGSRPPPCDNFSLTMTDKDNAVMFGGNTSPCRTSKTWILHLPTKTWSQHKERDPWPESRWSHIAACLCYGGQHQRLLISGGFAGFNAYDDMWLLDLESGRMEKVQVPEKYKKLIQRFCHGAAAVTVNSDCVEVILFGGRKDVHLLGSPPIADPVVLRFEFQMVSAKGGKWSLTDIADQTQLGSPARLATKRRIIQSSGSQGNKDGTIKRLEHQLQEFQSREEELQRRAGELQTQVNDASRRAAASNRRVEASNRRAEELQTQVDDANRRAEASNRRAGELQTQVDDANRRAEASNRRAGELQTQVDDANRRAEASNRRAGELQTQVNDANRQAEASHRRAGELHTQVDDANRRAEASNRRAGELQTQVNGANRRAEASNRRAEEFQTQVNDANRRAEASHRRTEELQTQVADARRRAGVLQTEVQGAEDRVQELQTSLAETTQELRQCEDLLTHWVVRREEIDLTGPELGVGGWATVTVAKFRGIQVAVKRIHNEIISHHNLQLFQREMNMAARLRHPNLIQFIGATMEGEMTIVMELMATSLRSQLRREMYFQPLLVNAISRDVARGLNYLHLIQPDPIVHRDISSANVLLEQLPLNQWRAKLTDYGSVNLVRLLRTENPGSPAYAAPEASNPRLQSPKMDIYSFGALILEMLTGRLPAPDIRPGMFRKVQHEQLLHLIRRCLNDNPEDRPNASDIISELDA